MSRNTRWGVPGNRTDQPVKHSTLVVARVATVNASVTPDTVAAQAFIDTPTVAAIRTPKVATDKRRAKDVQGARLQARLTTGKVVSAAIDADVTPTTVIAQAFIDTPSVSGDANITPTTVVAQAFIDTPTVTADANITPTTVTAQAFVDTPVVATIRVIHIATAVHRPRFVVQPARLQSRVTTGKVVTAAADANVTPTTVVAQAFIDTPSVTAIKTPQQVEAPGRAARNTRGPQLKIRSSVIQGRVPIVSADASVTPDTVVATAFIDTPSVSVGRAPKIAVARDRKFKLAGPQLRKRSTTIPIFPGVTVLDANVTAGDVAATVSIDTPTVDVSRPLAQTIAAVQSAAPPLRARLRSRRIQGRGLRNASITPTTVVAQASIDTPTVTGDANVTPTTVVAQAFVDTPGISTATDVSLTAGAVVLEAFIPTPTVTGNADVTTTTVAAVVSVPTPSTSGDMNLTLTTVVAQATVPGVVVTVTAPGDVDITPDTVVAVVNMDALPLVEPGGLIRHRGLIGYGFSNSSPFGNRRP